MTEQEAFDCGAFAAVNNYPVSSCPSMTPELTRRWVDGWVSVANRTLPLSEWSRIKHAKGLE